MNRILWGGATAASQYEGGLCDGKGLDTQDCRRWIPRTANDTVQTRLLTQDDVENAKEARADDAVYPFRVGSRGYEHWKSDLRQIIDLGLDIYRLSISWARLFPTGFEDEPNPVGVAYYDRVIRCLTDAGIRIFITINHYALPLAIVDKYGGWKHRDVIDLYLKMAKYVVDRWGSEVDYWLPINEINAGYFSPFNGLGIIGNDDHVYDYNSVFNGLHYQMVASALITEYGRDIGVPGKFVCMVSCFDYYALRPTPEDNMKLVHDEQINQWWCADVLANGEYGYYAGRFLSEHNVELDITEDDRDAMKLNTCDVVSFSYYSSSICSVDEKREQVPGNLVASLKNPNLEATAWGWQIDPIGLRIAAHKVYDRYRKPVMVAENGLGARDKVSPDNRIHDDYRISYLEHHMNQVELAVREGVDVEAYFVWGIIDIVSAGSCEMEKRYGVIYVDADNEGHGSYNRLRKDSYYWLHDFIATRK